MIRARVSPKAERDLDEHCGHIAGDNPEAAERVRRTILNTADFLAQHPGYRASAPARRLRRQIQQANQSFLHLFEFFRRQDSELGIKARE